MSQSLRIAVADDEPDLLAYYQQTLTRLGHQVVALARDGRELIEQCQAVKPDLIITDIKMPDMDGLTAAAALYEERPVPIILASAHQDEGLIARAEASHVLAYLIKPLRASDLPPSIAIAWRRFAEQQALEGLSLTDNLTGLCNHRGLLTLAEQQLRQARRAGRGLALLFVDVDGLKQVNDTLGHAAGDQLLQAAAEVLRRTFRGSDIIARLGGDEYAVLVTDDPGEGGGTVLTQRLLRNVEAYNAGRGAQAPALSLSVGTVAVDPAADLGVSEWLAEADRRMYQQKRGNREAGPEPG